MKAAGIGKVLALAGTLAGAGALTGCSDKPRNQKLIRDLGVSAKTYDSLAKLIQHDYNYSYNTEAGWQKAADSVYWTKKMDSAVAAAKQLGKQAAIDSLEKAGKIVR